MDTRGLAPLLARPLLICLSINQSNNENHWNCNRISKKPTATATGTRRCWKPWRHWNLWVTWHRPPFWWRQRRAAWKPSEAPGPARCCAPLHRTPSFWSVSQPFISIQTETRPPLPIWHRWKPTAGHMVRFSNPQPDVRLCLTLSLPWAFESSSFSSLQGVQSRSWAGFSNHAALFA